MRNGKRLTWDWEEFASPDFGRYDRKGIPEVILADRKTIEQSLAIARAFLERTGRAILSRVGPELEARVREEFAGTAELDWRPGSRCAVLRAAGAAARHRDAAAVRTGGRVGILTAGTSDIPAADEAAMMVREMGCEVFAVNDLGVAGLHRLVEPLREMLEERDVDVLVVAAGMDGALPTVVAGLATVPVVGLPTSVGYGHGGSGEAALSAMLQSGAPGLCVVNIDNGIGAGCIAGMIANRAAHTRGSAPDRRSAEPGPAAAKRAASRSAPRKRAVRKPSARTSTRRSTGSNARKPRKTS
jgi:NCAIR mutase (PurE)-related protein